jgi:hypothetical protein
MTLVQEAQDISLHVFGLGVGEEEEEVGPRSKGRVEGERHARIQGPELQWGILGGCGTERIQHQCSMTVYAIPSLEVVSF